MKRKQQQVEPEIELPSPPFREKTRIPRRKFALIYNAGGIGDYIHWTRAIQCAIETNPHIYGYIVTPFFFYELAHLWLSRYADRFEIKVSSDFEKEKYLEDIPCVAPNRSQYANAGGFHLFDLGFVYYLQNEKVTPGYEEIPRIEGDEADISRFALPEKYAVITVMATARNRLLNSDVINGLAEFYRAKGITPVFLGKRKVAKDYGGKEDQGIKTKDTIDLRDETTLVEAACVMARAHSVVGLDNGLLHLASCSAVPVVSIYTSVDPKTRQPPRRPGVKSVVIVPPEELKCRFCQSRMRYIIGHDFVNCLYDDYACTKNLTAKGITDVIEQALFS